MNNSTISSNIKRNTLILSGNSFVMSCVFQIILVVSPIIIFDSTKSIALASLTTTLVMCADIPTNYHAGKLSDNIGRKKTLLIGILIGLIALFALTISRLLFEDSLYWIGLVIFGLSSGFFVLNRAAIMDMYPQKRGQSLGYLNTSNIIGSFLTSTFITIVTGLGFITSMNFNNLLIFSCLPLLGFAGFLIILMRIDTKIISQILSKGNSSPDIKINNSKEKSWISGIYRKRDLLLAFIISSLSVGGVAIAYSLTPILLHIKEIELGLISYSVALIGLGTSGPSILFGRISDKIGRKKTVFLGGTIMGAGLFLIPIIDNYFAISFAAFLVGLGAGAVAIASTALICDIAVLEHRGKVFGANSFFINIITLPFPPLAATLLDKSGPLSVSILGLVTTITVFLLMALILSPKKTRPP